MPSIQEATNGLVGDISDIKYVLSSELELSLRDYQNADVVETTRAFVCLRRVKDELDELVKQFNKIYDDMRMNKLPSVFEAAGVPTVNLDEGYRVTVSHLVRASIKADARTAAYQWLRDNQLGDLVTETVNASTLSAVAKSMAEENKELDPDLFTVAVIPSTSVTRTK